MPCMQAFVVVFVPINHDLPFATFVLVQSAYRTPKLTMPYKKRGSGSIGHKKKGKQKRARTEPTSAESEDVPDSGNEEPIEEKEEHDDETPADDDLCEIEDEVQSRRAIPFDYSGQVMLTIKDYKQKQCGWMKRLSFCVASFCAASNNAFCIVSFCIDQANRNCKSQGPQRTRWRMGSPWRPHHCVSRGEAATNLVSLVYTTTKRSRGIQMPKKVVV